jgi:hypothetical protein
VSGRPLHFQTGADPALKVKPFHAFKKEERYFLYRDPSWSRRFSAHLFHFNGAWLWDRTRELGAGPRRNSKAPRCSGDSRADRTVEAVKS